MRVVAAGLRRMESASSDGGGGGGGRIVGFGNSADSKSKSVISESQTHTREKHHSLIHSLTPSLTDLLTHSLTHSDTFSLTD